MPNSLQSLARWLRSIGALTALGLAGALSAGCDSRPNPEEFGEIITEVPQRLNKPFPLPELDEPTDEPTDGNK